MTPAGERPEARDPAVKRCADAARTRLEQKGFDGASAGGISARRADACILRWQSRFNSADPTKVATLIVVPIDVELRSGTSSGGTTIYARCGLTNDKLQALDIVATDSSC